MSTKHHFIIAVVWALFLTPAVYGEMDSSAQNSGNSASLCRSNPKNLACSCLKDPGSRSCMCAQSCGLTTLTTHAEALTHPGYAACYKKGVVSPSSGCLALKNHHITSLDAWALAAETLIGYERY
ncbi:MAG: hypothetical protein HYX35_03595 [Proteobacteria bacterium]|nr:hypothetical protein [Pseudomonadota bacterium]